MLRACVKQHISHAKHAPREQGYVLCMAKKRPLPARTLADNLNKLMVLTGWSNRHLAELSGVSDRYIGMIRKNEFKATIDIAEALAKPFGLTGWQIIMPDVDADLARSGRLAKLIKNYQKAGNSARDYIDTVAERESKYGS